MLVPDVLIAQALGAEWAAVRADADARADLLAEADASLRTELERYLTDPKTKVEIRPGLPVEQTRAPVVAVLLEGEEEDDDPIGRDAVSGFDPDDDGRTALSVAYVGPTNHVVTLQVIAGALTTTVVDPLNHTAPRVLANEVSLTFGLYPTIQGLADALNATGLYTAAVGTGWAVQPTSQLEKQRHLHLERDAADVLAAGTRWVEVRAVLFSATYRVIVLAANANAALWLHAFAKWALLRQRDALEEGGLISQQLAAGDFGQDRDWGPDWAYTRSVFLTARYLAKTARVYATPLIDHTVAVPADIPAAFRTFA